MRYGGIAILAVCAGLLGLLKLFETQLTYPLDPTDVRPAEIGLAMQRQIMTTPDGTEVIVWHAPPAAGQPIVLYFQGNAGGLGNRAQRFEVMMRAGLGISALAYRGSTGSGGAPYQQALSADAKLLAQLTAAQYPEVEIAYFGESLGTGVAAWLATEIAPARMVLEAPYTSIPDAALQSDAPGWVRVLFANLWDTEVHVASVTAPLLVLHGIEDQVIPVEQGRAVYGAAGSTDKRILTLPGVGHQDVWQPEVQAEFLKFLKG